MINIEDRKFTYTLTIYMVASHETRAGETKLIGGSAAGGYITK
jgi:hypothetical protein